MPRVIRLTANIRKAAACLHYTAEAMRLAYDSLSHLSGKKDDGTGAIYTLYVAEDSIAAITFLLAVLGVDRKAFPPLPEIADLEERPRLGVFNKKGEVVDAGRNGAPGQETAQVLCRWAAAHIGADVGKVEDSQWTPLSGFHEVVWQLIASIDGVSCILSRTDNKQLAARFAEAGLDIAFSSDEPTAAQLVSA